MCLRVSKKTYVFNNQLFKPRSVKNIVVRNTLNLAFEQFGRELFHAFGRNPCVHSSGMANRILQHHSPCRDEAIFFYHHLIHNDGAHAHQHVVVQSAAVYQRSVTDADVVADRGTALLVGTMEDGPVLYVDFVTDSDKVYIAAHHSLKPYGALVAHGDVADDGGVFSEEAVGAKLGGEFATRNDERHEIYDFGFTILEAGF